MTFLSEENLNSMGFKSLGKNVKISEKASFYNCNEIVIGDNSRIDDFCVISGNVSIGRNLTGATTAFSIMNQPTILSDVTSSAFNYNSLPNTQAAAFTLSNLHHFRANQGTIGAGSTVTNQYGFFAGGTLIGANNNYGFYSNISANTGRYNFYAAGTADNYFAGAVGIGTTSLTGFGLNNSKNLTGATASYAYNTSSIIQSDVTSGAIEIGRAHV